MMRTLLSGIATSLLLAPFSSFAIDRGTCERDFAAAFQSRGELSIHVRPGDIDIKGSEQDKVSVSCEMRDSHRAHEVKISFRSSGKSGDLRINGGPNNGFHIYISVPHDSHLFVRSPAGDLSVSGVVGNKDVEMHAGDLVIAVGRASDYSHADASVLAGDLTASAFGVNKDGLFRSFERNNPSGKYRLHAHVGAGDLVLK